MKENKTSKEYLGNKACELTDEQLEGVDGGAMVHPCLECKHYKSLGSLIEEEAIPVPSPGEGGEFGPWYPGGEIEPWDPGSWSWDAGEEEYITWGSLDKGSLKK